MSHQRVTKLYRRKGCKDWKEACCIDCAWVVNGIFLGSMVKVITQKCRQDVSYVPAAICSTLTCCCCYYVESPEEHTASEMCVKNVVLLFLIFSLAKQAHKTAVITVSGLVVSIVWFATKN